MWWWWPHGAGSGRGSAGEPTIPYLQETNDILLPRILYEGSGELLSELGQALFIARRHDNKRLGLIRFEGLVGFSADWEDGDSGTPGNVGWTSGIFAESSDSSGTTRASRYKARSNDGTWVVGRVGGADGSSHAIGGMATPAGTAGVIYYDHEQNFLRFDGQGSAASAWTGANRPVLFQLLVIGYQVPR